MTIAEQFESYKASVIPPKANPVTVTECKRAFYAGAQAYRAACLGIVLDTESEEAGGKAILELRDELNKFYAAVLAGQE